ncbi:MULTISPECIES: hypothetical protein [unclassified Salinivibrio]|uniref:hypothetical protein n=1 Tax=unclassified Salinivibrio TaxID=2636825 RepID=UPI00084BD777|nr:MULTISPECIES: hypothetical protein [unclassified Salinivibrio]ODQ01767.1 hypothetical protein BGK46_01555 [Salinivibrio sp. DV]OOF20731.1 hypothetical protein BZJ17_11910 [Salinivibrio sp. IB574]
MHYLTKFGFISALLFSSAAGATNFNYNYLQFDVLSNPGGLGASTKFVIADGAHLVARGDSQFEGDWFSSVGAGFHAPINDFVDIYGEIEGAWLKRPEAPHYETGELTTVIGGGLRAWLAPSFEADTYIGSIIFDKDDSKSIVEFGGRFHSTETLSLGATWRANGLEENRLIFSVRYLY